MKRCPTEAIRVRDGKAKVIYERCIGCGECIRICPNRAKKAIYDDFDAIRKYKYKIALPSPSLYGQFENLTDINCVLEGLLRIGFDDIFEVSGAAELVSEATRKLAEKGAARRPIISTACPAVVELILIRFHNLRENLMPMLAPVDVAAKLARRQAAQKSGLPDEEIGVFFISPCPAKVFAIKSSLGTERPYIDGVLAQSEVYFKLLAEIKKITAPRELAKSGIVGIGWAASGGEAAGTLKDNYLAADGIENCMSVLKELENGKLKNVDFIELNACPGGCVGGVLNVENPFIAKSRILRLRKYMPVSKNHMSGFGVDEDFFLWEREPKLISAFRFDEDRSVALSKMRRQEEILRQLPGLDCGSCGAPSCSAFSEDVVNGIIEYEKCARMEHGNGNDG